MQKEFIQYIFDNMFSGYLVEIYNNIATQKINFVEEKYNILHLAFICRFIFYFRNFLDKKSILEIAKILSFFVKTKNESLLSSIFYTIEGIMDLKEGDLNFLVNLTNVFNSTNIHPQINDILQNLYNVGKRIDLNNYLLKVMLSIVKLLKVK